MVVEVVKVVADVAGMVAAATATMAGTDNNQLKVAVEESAVEAAVATVTVIVVVGQWQQWQKQHRQQRQRQRWQLW